jgi:flagellar basal body-associated protein FliL
MSKHGSDDAPKKGHKGLKIAVIVIVLLVVIGALASGGKGSSSSGGTTESATTSQDSAASQDSSASQSQAAPKEDYTISEEAADTSSQYDYAITGILTNNTDKTLSYIQVEYVLYDADGNQVGTALANTNNLKAGGTWKYKASSLVDTSKVAKYERAEITAY